MSSTQIDRIKEKFAKMNNIQENSGSQSSKRHSTMFGGHNQDRAPVLANYMNSALSKSLKSLNTIDLGDMGGRIAHGNSVMSMSMSMQPHEANIVAAPSSKRAMNKYQKSITCDLSSYILGATIKKLVLFMILVREFIVIGHYVSLIIVLLYNILQGLLL